jgi:hypothetical protein
VEKLIDQLLTSFPEIAPRLDEGDAEKPYLAMGYLVEWLDEIGKDGFSPAIIQRFAEFARWCELQPRGETASDDIWTIYVVAVFENLFLHEHTPHLIPHVTSKADLEANEECLVSWVGKEKYERALRQFSSKSRGTSRKT